MESTDEWGKLKKKNSGKTLKYVAVGYILSVLNSFLFTKLYPKLKLGISFRMFWALECFRYDNTLHEICDWGLYIYIFFFYWIDRYTLVQTNVNNNKTKIEIIQSQTKIEIIQSQTKSKTSLPYYVHVMRHKTQKCKA